MPLSLELFQLSTTSQQSHEEVNFQTPSVFKPPTLPVTAPARSRVELQTPNWSEKTSLTKEQLEDFSASLDKKLDIEKIKINCSKLIEKKYGKNQFEKNLDGRRPNYAVRQKIDANTDILVQVHHHEDPDKQNGLITAMIRKETFGGIELDVFQKQIPGKSWDECTPAEMQKIKDADFTAEDINLKCTPGVTSLFVAEFPFKNRDGDFITSVGVVNSDGKVKFPSFHKRGMATGQNTVEFIGTAFAGVRCGVSSNKTNQLKNATQADLHQHFQALDPILGEMTNPQNYNGSRSKMNSLMVKVINSSPDLLMSKIQDLGATCISFDAKTVKFSTQEKNKNKDGKEVVVLAATGDVDKNDVPLGALPTNLDHQNKDKTSEALYSTLKDLADLVFNEDQLDEFRGKLIGCVFDTTLTNTGWRSGVCERLQHGFRRHLLQFACRNHIKDTECKRNFVRDLFDGPSKGDGIGGDLSKCFHAWNDFQKDPSQWEKYEIALKVKIAKEGSCSVYDSLEEHEKYSDLKNLVKWLADEDKAIFKKFLKL